MNMKQQDKEAVEQLVDGMMKEQDKNHMQLSINSTAEEVIAEVFKVLSERSCGFVVNACNSYDNLVAEVARLRKELSEAKCAGYDKFEELNIKLKKQQMEGLHDHAILMSAYNKISKQSSKIVELREALIGMLHCECGPDVKPGECCQHVTAAELALAK